MNGLKVVFCVAFLFFSGVAAADKMVASQIPDQISGNGMWRDWLLNRPLTPYLYAHPGVMPKPDQILPENARGYVAEWFIKDDKLYLKAVSIFVNEKGKEFPRDINVLTNLFPGASSVFAEWYSGALVIQSFQENFTKTRYKVIAVSRGVTSAPVEFSEEAFNQHKAEMFAAYKQTEAYRLRLSEFFSINPGYPIAAIEEFLYNTDHERYLLTATALDNLLKSR